MHSKIAPQKPTYETHTAQTRPAPPPNPNTSPNTPPCPKHHIPPASTCARARSHSKVGSAFARARRAPWAPQTSRILLPDSKQRVSSLATHSRGGVRTSVRLSAARARVPACDQSEMTLMMRGMAWRARRCRRACFDQVRGLFALCDEDRAAP